MTIEFAAAMTLVCLAQTGVIAVLILDRRLERRETKDERADLLQRIQAPQHAIIQHYNEGQDVVAPPAVRSDDDADEEYWKAHETREELADRLMAEEQRG